ncbi:hypothetical protein ASPWEDRAFT_43593, partial [Aspergillus wentii DTO 134E9]
MQFKSIISLFAFINFAFPSAAGEFETRQNSLRCFCCHQAVQPFLFFRGAGNGCLEIELGDGAACGTGRPSTLCCPRGAITSGTGGNLKVAC